MRGKRARRYWRPAASDDALPPYCAVSTAAFRRVTLRSDERIEGQTFDLCDGPGANPARPSGAVLNRIGIARQRPDRCRAV